MSASVRTDSLVAMDGDLALLTGTEAGRLLAAAVGAAGGELVGWRPGQVDHRPGRSTTAVYRTTVRWGGTHSQFTIRRLHGNCDGLSSWQTWPNVNPRRNVPSVDGARTPPKTRAMPPWRSTFRSLIESAPATMPATIENTFAAGFAPATPATLNRSDQPRQAHGLGQA